MYFVGDKVVHPMHGAGRIESIVHEKIGGAYHDYYVFKMPMNGLVLKIPTNSISAIGIRPIESPEQIEAVIKGLMCRDQQRGLSTGERKMLYIAKQILISEVSLAEDLDYKSVEQRINDAVRPQT